MFDREKAIKLLLADEINAITECVKNNDFEYLSETLTFGCKGWVGLTDAELFSELIGRGLI